jgi:two-component system OmpR family sensor kinase
VKLPFVAAGGTSYPSIDGEPWIMFTVVHEYGIVQAAQRQSARYTLAAHTAGQLVLPLLALAAVVGGLFVLALRRGLQPLDRAAKDIAAKSVAALTPLNVGNAPRELAPLVASINGLITRLSTAFDTQRRFLADAAHELRTPVTALRIQLALLKDADSNVERAEALRLLTSGVARAQNLTEQLLQISRSEPGGYVPEATPLDLGEIARQCVSALDTKARSCGIDLGAVVAEHVAVRGDAEQLTVLVNNLIDNAIRYTHEGGKIDVMVNRQGGAASLAVVDNGPGIPQEERERVFDRFYRGTRAPALSREATGSGLGLSIVKAIADQHGANVTLLAGYQGTGTKVEVRFPSGSQWSVP